MEYPPQLNPVQAWLLGYLDTAALRDHTADSADLAAAYGRVIRDDQYAMALIVEAQLIIEDGAG